MKHPPYSIYYISVILLALVMLTSSCSQPIDRIAVSCDDVDELFRQEPIDTKTIMLPGDVLLELVWIPPGSFMMGSTYDEQGRIDSEGPQHEVTIAEGFWMGKHPITQAQWQAIMRNNPSYFNGVNKPVEKISWNDIRETNGFLDKLNAVHPGYKFRLPSEAEWEYAYRAGTNTRFYWGDDPEYTEIDDYAWYRDNSNTGNERETHEVGLKLPNAWGLHDMAGNVWEWCDDNWYDNYEGVPSDGNAWIDNPRDSFRLLRGGAWLSSPSYCRAARRVNLGPDGLLHNVGFRVVCDID